MTVPTRYDFEPEASIEPALPIGQAALWNGPAGHAWVESQALLDAMLAPLLPVLLEPLSRRPGAEVLDVGCGTGALALAAARAGARCTGIDISAPMIALARARAEREAADARFVCADAQRHEFGAGYDLILSRLGVMFFDDPVAAFARLRGALREGGTMRFVAWRGAAENPFMTTAERAAAPLLPSLPPRPPGGPGQFAFADAQHVREILREAGWRAVELRGFEAECGFAACELPGYLGRLGPVGLALAAADEAARARIVEAIVPAFAPFVHGERIRFQAACWCVDAEA